MITAAEASFAGRFVGQLAASGLVPRSQTVAAIGAAGRLYADEKTFRCFLRGFGRAMNEAGKSTAEVNAFLDQAQGEVTP